MAIDTAFTELKLKDDNFKDKEITFDADLEDMIQRIAIKEGLSSYNIERKLLSNVGGNYLGILYEVNIKGKNQKELNLFLKKIIMGDKMSLISVTDAYTKEIYVYDELSKIFNELQDEAKIHVNDKYEIVKCYGVHKKSNSETLILENLSKKNYVTCDRFKSIRLKFAELSIMDLAKFHALGYVLKKKRSKYFESMIKSLKVPFNIDDKWTEFVKCITRNTLERVGCNILRGKLEKFIENKMIKGFETYYKPSEFSTLCHGDFRANNVLVKEKNGEYVKTMVVDYQLIYHGCPLNDFMYFIFGATDQKFRKNHLENLKNLYYRTLKDFLKHFRIDVEEVYPRKEFEKDFKERLEYGLMMALMVLPFILASEEDVPDFAENDLTEMKISENEDGLFKERILGILDDFENWGYL